MIPEHRLAVLLDQVQDQQIRQCLYHNTTQPPSLYHDHECDRGDFPMHLYQDLREHTDEVWYLEFSHDGSMLASAGKDNKVVIYSTTNWRSMWQFQEDHDMGSSDTGICYISWSPDDRYLLSCSQAKEMVLYDTRTGHKIGTIDHFTYPVTTAAWAPDGSSFVVGSQDSARPLGLYEFPSQENVYTWLSEDEVSMRINDCSISADGSRLAAITSDSRVLVYNFQTREKLAEWSMEDRLTCVGLSSNGKSLLVSMNEGRLMLLDSETGRVKQRYSSLRQSEFVIRSAFGGANENFVISGSEGEFFRFDAESTPCSLLTLDMQIPASTSGGHRQANWWPLSRRTIRAPLTASRGIRPISPFSLLPATTTRSKCKSLPFAFARRHRLDVSLPFLPCVY